MHEITDERNGKGVTQGDRRCKMVSFGRNKTISTIVCLVLFSAYLYAEFRVKQDQVVDGKNSETDFKVEVAQRVAIGDSLVTVTPHESIKTLQFRNESAEKQPSQTTKPQNIEEKEKTKETTYLNLDKINTNPDTVNKNPDNIINKDPDKNTEDPDKVNPNPNNVKPVSTNGVVVRKFDPNQPKFILLLAQQRVGSTFIGGIFDRNTDAVYVYEPLEGVYTHLYGTKKGWAVPLDIHFHWNSSYRHLPAFEMQAVSKLIEQIFTCDYHNMLTEFLVHEFWGGFKQTQAQPYATCLKQIKVSVSKCQQYLQTVCPGRVGQNLAKEKDCRNQLQLVFSGKPAAQPFKQYKACMDTQRSQVVQKCVPIIDRICNSKALRVIKTVRMDLETVVSLMEKYQNMRVVHLVRDPRAVVLSRIKSGWSTHGTTNLKASRASLKSQQPKTSSAHEYHVNGSIDYDEFSLGDEMKMAPIPPNGVAHEAQMYCSLTRKDIITRRHLEQKYPGSTYQMIYEHMVYHPLHELERIYEFVDEPIPHAIVNWVKTLNSGAKKSQSIATKWKNEVSVESAKQIDKFCQNLYDTIEYSWPDPVQP